MYDPVIFMRFLYGPTDFMHAASASSGRNDRDSLAAAHRSTKRIRRSAVSSRFALRYAVWNIISTKLFLPLSGKLTERERHILCDCLREIDRGIASRYR